MKYSPAIKTAFLMILAMSFLTGIYAATFKVTVIGLTSIMLSGLSLGLFVSCAIHMKVKE